MHASVIYSCQTAQPYNKDGKQYDLTRCNALISLELLRRAGILLFIFQRNFITKSVIYQSILCYNIEIYMPR